VEENINPPARNVKSGFTVDLLLMMITPLPKRKPQPTTSLWKTP
jgi:hypothetical protein